MVYVRVSHTSTFSDQMIQCGSIARNLDHAFVGAMLEPGG